MTEAMSSSFALSSSSRTNPLPEEDILGWLNLSSCTDDAPSTSLFVEPSTGSGMLRSTSSSSLSSLTAALATPMSLPDLGDSATPFFFDNTNFFSQPAEEIPSSHRALYTPQFYTPSIADSIDSAMNSAPGIEASSFYSSTVSPSSSIEVKDEEYAEDEFCDEVCTEEPKKRGRKKGKKNSSSAKPAKFVKEPHVVIKDEFNENVLVCKQVHDKEKLVCKQAYNMAVSKDLRLGKGSRKPIEKHISFDCEIPTMRGYIRSTYKHKQEVLGFHVMVKPEWDLNKDRYPPGHKIWIWAGSDCLSEVSAPLLSTVPSAEISQPGSLEPSPVSTPTLKRKLEDAEEPEAKRRRIPLLEVTPVTKHIKRVVSRNEKSFFAVQTELGADLDQVWEMVVNFQQLSQLWPSLCSSSRISCQGTVFSPLGWERTVEWRPMEGVPAGTAIHKLAAVSELDHSLTYVITYHNNFPQIQGSAITLRLKSHENSDNISVEIGSDDLAVVQLLEPRLVCAVRDMRNRWPPVPTL